MALPLASAAVVAPAGSPSRQYPPGPSASSRSRTPRSSGPSAQLTWELLRGGERRGEHRDLIERALEGIEVLPQPTDKALTGAAVERSARGGRANERAVDIEPHARAVEGPHQMGPAAHLKDRAFRPDEAARGVLHAELGHARLEVEHVLAVHRAAHGLLEDPAVL